MVEWLLWLLYRGVVVCSVGDVGGVGGGVVVLPLRRVGVTGRHRFFDMVFRSTFFGSLGRW